MPCLTKEALSKYIRTECKRQLRLYLSPDNARYRQERLAEGMPDPEVPRPGLHQIRAAGDEWQAEKLHDLTLTFGTQAIVGKAYAHPSGQTRYDSTPLTQGLIGAAPNRFLLEMEYEVGSSFKQALGIEEHKEIYDLDYANVRPDIIEVLPPQRASEIVTPGGDIERLPAGDDRLQLHIIDIKLTAEPSPSYFAEVTYYMMVLAGWLIDNGLNDRFVVSANGAIWPGKHDASRLTLVHRELIDQGEEPTPELLRQALGEDLQIVPFDVFAFRLRRFLRRDVPEVLSHNWRDLDWHVDTSCSGCEYLGNQWVSPDERHRAHSDHCLPNAERRDHLSRIAFLTRGVRGLLADTRIDSVRALAACDPAHPVFDQHQNLRATRTVLAARAASLHNNQAQIPPLSGTSAVMPAWTDLRFFLSVDFDIGSAITFAFGLKAFWLEPRPFGQDNGARRQTRSWGPYAMPVDRKSLEDEQRELIALLDRVNSILQEARNLNPETTVQFYIWDSLQYEHLTRVIGRHLGAILANRSLQHLAWLFPPEEVLPNPRMSTRFSPITIVGDVIRSVLAAPVSHYYSLLRTARVYHEPNLPQHLCDFRVSPLFEDILSDMIPSERAHEIWTRSTGARHWNEQLRLLGDTVKARLRALESVTKRLEADLKPTLDKTAPKINIGPPSAESRLSVDSQLWYAFAKLNEALAELEVHQVRAMPPHEREARLHSARLRRRLTGDEEEEALRLLGLDRKPGRRVYKMRDNSREVKMREGDFNFALAPEQSPDFLDKSIAALTRGTPLETDDPRDLNTRVDKVTKVTVAGLNRENCIIALDPNRRWPTMLDDIETFGIANLSNNAVLDPIHEDFFTKKLLAALRAIGNPDIARDDPIVRMALGQLTRRSRRTAHTPAADFLWNAHALYETRVARDLSQVRDELVRQGITLNEKQWEAWEQSLSRRLQLIWGPPGTGKSQTVRAVVLGATLEALMNRRSIRILICASTYTAIDTVLLPVYSHVIEQANEESIELRRVRSYLKPREQTIPDEIDVELNKVNPSDLVLGLRDRLEHKDGIIIVGTPSEQIHNLLVMADGPAQQELFDLILIDEASQMDVAHAVLPICSLASSGTIILAGDPKQLPPIHQAEPPAGLEAMVGSVYAFAERVHRLPAVMLNRNYRSNSTIVGFLKNGGYDETLESHFPQLRLDFTGPIPGERPPDWPESLIWTRDWAGFLDPDNSAVCFIYPDGRSGQWNRFEADAIAALAYLLHGRMANRLLGESDDDEHGRASEGILPYSPAEFWAKALGIVTPHRAQQGLIVARLQQIFEHTGVPVSAIRNAVDTVERFQGQQRDVVIASFGLGDPDTISQEDEFLMSFNRFNVMASRPRVKFIVFASEELIDHLSGDQDTLTESRLLKKFVHSFCGNERQMTLYWLDGDRESRVDGLFKYR